MLAVAIRGLVERGELDEARERFGELVAPHQRRASRIAFQYLRDAADADEAVQDAFLKVFSAHRLVSGSLAVRGLVHADPHQRLSSIGAKRGAARSAGSWAAKSRARTKPARRRPASPSNPEHRLPISERRARLASAIDRLDGRQRTVFMLCHYGDCTPREVSVMTGLNESTVRVHLFRAARKLRGLLGGQP
jgi:RNA polymerase sigma-70 factor (ECF subfamily)